METRKLLVGHSNPGATRRVVVAGFGDSYPLSGLDPNDGRNRHVELHFATGKSHRLLSAAANSSSDAIICHGSANDLAQAFADARRRSDINRDRFQPVPGTGNAM